MLMMVQFLRQPLQRAGELKHESSCNHTSDASGRGTSSCLALSASLLMAVSWAMCDCAVIKRFLKQREALPFESFPYLSWP